MKKRWYSMKISEDDEKIAEVCIHDEIGGWGIKAADFYRDLKAMGDVKTIALSIHSPGGDVFEGLAIHNMLQNHPAKVVARVEGLAASMASVVLMAADEIVMPRNSFLMIHQPWSMAIGDADDLRKEASLLDKAARSLVGAYAARGIDEELVRGWMTEETWFSAAEALEAGLIDRVDEEMAMAATLPSKWSSRFAHLPPGLTPTAGHMTAKKRWWEVMAGASKAELTALEDEVTDLKIKLDEAADTIAKQGETIEELAQQLTDKEAAATAKIRRIRDEHELQLAEAIASTDAKAKRVALELAAAQGVPPQEVPVPSAHDHDDPHTPQAIKAVWMAMEEGAEKREYFRKHKAVLLG